MESTTNFPPMTGLYGRQQIFTTREDITSENVISVINEVLPIHCLNMQQEEYLYWYRRGLQPVVNRTKTVRPEICNIVVENHANEIVAFKNGYFLTQPAYYASRRSKDQDITDKVDRMNEYLYLSGKQQADDEIVDWFHTVGVGVAYIRPNDDPEIPVRAFSLDPRSAFVAYSHAPGHPPVFGCNITATGKDSEDGLAEIVFDVYTRTRVFRLLGGITGEIITSAPIYGTAYRVLSEEINVLGEIPIIEYQYEENRLGAFESVITALDALNNIASNRVDGVEQFIQSLMVFYNCKLDDNPDGTPITPAMVREIGAVFLKSVGQDRADIKILSEQLDQTQTQVLVDSIYEKVLSICGLPSTTKGGTSTSDTGAAVLYRDGWYQADTFAENTKSLFIKANRYFDRIFLKILNSLPDPIGLSLSDFELRLVRNPNANIIVKTQAALNMKTLGLSPEIALGRSGVSNDPVSDVVNSESYIKAAWGASTETIDETRTDVLV